MPPRKKNPSRTNQNRDQVLGVLPEVRPDAPKKGKGASPLDLQRGGVREVPLRGTQAKVEQALLDEAFGGGESADLILQDFSREALERELAILGGAITEETRAWALESFWFFVTEVLFPHTWKEHYSPEFHQELCQRIQKLGYGEDFWCIVPREHRKSFIMTVAHSIWLIVRDPDVRILLVGARDETVKPFARLILSAFLKGTPGFEKFQAVFPDFVIEGRGRNIQQAFQFTHPRRRAALPDPTFRATYLGVTGAGWRCDVLKFDDPVERRNVTSPELSFKTLGQMMDLFPLVDSTSAYKNIFGAGTRWAYHDPYGRILGETFDETPVDAADIMDRLGGQKSKIHILVRHALEGEGLCDQCPPHVTRESPHGPPDMEHGRPIALPIHTRDTIFAQYEKYRMDPLRGESMFWHQYMNICLAPSDQRFQSTWFIDAHLPDWPAARKKILCIDSADKDFQQEGRGDFMVAQFGSFDDNGRLMKRHGLRSREWTRDEFIRRITTWCQAVNWWPVQIVKEKVSNDTFLADIRREFLRVNRPVAVSAIVRPPKLKKLDFIVEALQSPMERGDVVYSSLYPKDLRAREEYELCNLGQVAHDDVADCAALFFMPSVRVQTPNRMVVEQGWTPPVLELGRQVTPGSMVTFSTEDALGTKDNIIQAFVDLGGYNEASWDTPRPDSFRVGLGDYE